eukprot:gene298-171_t
MDDILFPWWISRSHAMSIAAAMRLQFQSSAYHHYDIENSESKSIFPSSPSETVFVKKSDCSDVLYWALDRSSRIYNSDESPYQSDKYTAKSSAMGLLYNAHIVQLLTCSKINDISSGKQTRMSLIQCTSVIALMAIAVECKSLPHELIKGFLTECSSLYSSLVARLPTLTFAEGIEVEDFCASLIACGLQLRMDESEVSQPHDLSCGYNTSGTGDAASALKSDAEECSRSIVAKGALRGLCLTRSRRSVFWGPDLVHRIQSLTDAFAGSPRKDHTYKRMLMLLLEAMSCSKCLHPERESRWIVAILQGPYIVSSLFQKEALHARVVASALSLLIRHYQDTAKKLHISLSGGTQSFPDFSEGDHLIDSVWSALHWAKDVNLNAIGRTPTLYGTNLQLILSHLLYVELERLRCCARIQRVPLTEKCNSGFRWGEMAHLVQGFGMKYKDTVPSSSSAPSVSRSRGIRREAASSGEEETLRIHSIGNIVKLVLSPSSALAWLPTTGKYAFFRQNICAMLARVLSVLTSCGVEALPSSVEESVAPPVVGQRTWKFSSPFYRNLEGMAHLLVNRMVREFGGSGKESINEAAASAFILEINITPGEEKDNNINHSLIPTNSAAATCLIGLCGSDTHMRSFVVAVLMDFVSKACTTLDQLVTAPESALPIESVNNAFGSLCHILVPSIKRETLNRRIIICRSNTIDDIKRCTQLLCSTIVNALRGELQLPGKTLTSMVNNGELPTIGMTAPLEVLWELTCRVLLRLQELVKCGSEVSEDQWTDVAEETINIITVLLHETQSCLLALAWPGSGVLFEAGVKKSKTSGKTLAQAAARCIALLLRPINVLMNLLPTGSPVTREELAFHVDRCMRFVIEKGDEEKRYMCYFSSRVELDTTTECCNPLFRSCWLLLTYYNMTSDAVSLTRPRLVKDLSNTVLRSSLTMSEVRDVATCASAARPLLLMRSSEIQQVTTDIQVLVNRMGDIIGDPHLSEKKLRSLLAADFLRACPKSSKALAKLTVAELFLVKSIFELEQVRITTGSFSTICLYHHFDIREFVASSALSKAIRFMTEHSCTYFTLAAKNCSIPDYASKLLWLNTRQLLLYATFAVRSVRECAIFYLRQLLRAFPMPTVQGGGLPVLWRLIDIVEVANPDEIASYCEQVRYRGIPAVAMEYKSAERKSQLQVLQELAQEWAHLGRVKAPADMLHVATQFMTSEYAEGVSVASMHSGTKLAVIAGQMEDSFDKSERVGKGTSSVVIKLSRARGSILSSLAYASPRDVEERILKRISILVQGERKGMKGSGRARNGVATGTDSTASEADVSERFLAKLEAELYAATVMIDIPPRRWETQGMLLLYLVQSPIKLFSAKAIRIAAECWSWLIIRHREACVMPILRHIVEGIQWTFSEKLGIFDAEQTYQKEMVESGQQQGSVPPAVDTLETPHHSLFKFIIEHYLRHDSAMSQNSSVLSLLYGLASMLVQHPHTLSLKDRSLLERIEALVLVGKIVHQLFIANIRHLRANRTITIPFTSIGFLRQRWFRAVLQWHRKSPPSWFFATNPAIIPNTILAVESMVLLLRTEKKSLRQNSIGFLDFSLNLSVPGKNIGHIPSCRRRELTPSLLSEASLKKLSDVEQTRLDHLLDLILFLVDHELLRLRVWEQPRRTMQLTDSMAQYRDSCERCMSCAVMHEPGVAVAMASRLSGIFPQMAQYLSQHIVNHPEKFLHVPEAAYYYLTSDVIRSGAPKLHLFANAGIIQSLRWLDPQYSCSCAVTSYAIRSLLSKDSGCLIFYLPQILQVFGSDKSGKIRFFMLKMARSSTIFCHQLLWSLRTEEEGSSDMAKNCRALKKTIVRSLAEAHRNFYQQQFDFMDRITSLSGELMSFEKLDRKPQLRQRLTASEFHIPPTQHHIYLPTNPELRIADVISQTASAMQSAAKCPIFVQFECVTRDLEDMTKPELLPPIAHPHRRACIFKMGDDCRQDQLALQLIELFRRIFQPIGVPAFLYPYRVVTTGQTSGIIECVPNSLSRNEIGKLVESNLAEYFVQSFGHPETSTFRRARENFVKSAAAYSIVTFVLNIKDRHNGNIMVDASGHLVHIDFGFLFDTSPGGDMNFESSPFKLTTEMIQLIGRDVGSSSTLKSPALEKALIDEDNYTAFKVLANRCYLAVRQYSREICMLVELMLRSGLPCFKPEQTIKNLAKRLCMDESEIAAAHFMRRRIHESKQNLRTKLYDHFQRIAEGIDM